MRIGLFFRPEAVPIGVDLDNAIAIAHFAFLTDKGGFARAKDELTRMGITYEEADSGIAVSLFIHDPDGHEIEVTTYH